MVDAVRFNLLLGDRGRLRSLLRKQCLHFLYYLIRARNTKAIRVNDLLFSNKDTELTEPAFDRFRLRVVFLAALTTPVEIYHSTLEHQYG